MFKVTRRIGRSEADLQRFAKREEAENFIQQKLDEDRDSIVKPTYCLYDEIMESMSEFNQNNPVVANSRSPQSESQSANGSGQTFSPTPFNMAPRPGGVPHNWLKEEEGKKK